MNKKDLEKLARALGADKLSESSASDGTTNLVMACPLAPWTHENGTDRSRGFSVRIDEHGLSPYRCWACDATGGSLSDLLERLAVYDPKKYYPLWQQVYQSEENAKSKSLRKRLHDWKDKEQERKDAKRALGDQDLEPFAGGVPSYILQRGIDIETCKTWELGYDKSSSDPRLVFPVRDVHGDLVGLVGRAINDGQEPKYKNYWGFEKTKYLYGEHLAVTTPERDLVLVEGMIDALAVWQAGFSGLAVLGAFPSPAQVQKVIAFAGTTPVRVFFDNDEAGEKAKQRLIDLVDDRIPLRFFNNKETKKADPADLLAQGCLRERLETL